MTDEIQILCPGCLGDHLQHHSKNTDDYYMCMKDNCYEKYFSTAQSYQAQLTAARKEIAELKAQIPRSTNIDDTQFCGACVELQRQVERLTRERLEMLDWAKRIKERGELLLTAVNCY